VWLDSEQMKQLSEQERMYNEQVWLDSEQMRQLSEQERMYNEKQVSQTR
jgi:Zn-finger nucleic acid-binding protein